MEKLTELKASSFKRLNIDKPLSRLTRVDHMPYFQYLSYKANKLLNIFYPPTLRNTPSHNREGSIPEVTTTWSSLPENGVMGDGACPHSCHFGTISYHEVCTSPLWPQAHRQLPTCSVPLRGAGRRPCKLWAWARGIWGGIFGSQVAKHGLRSYQSVVCARTGKWTNAAKQSPETDLHIYSYFICCKITTGGKGSPFP